KGKNSIPTNTQDTSGLFNTDVPAADFLGITQWLNTDNKISIKDLKGKVVLVDFWTYTCINCIRTLPYVTSWYDKYHNLGFTVIGIHTPEFEFEKNTQNVQNAIKQFNIHYPVGQDNNYATWNNYNNQYWPAEYLIDAQGNIRRTHFGEGEYDQMEKAIQALIAENGKKVQMPLDSLKDQTPVGQISPETYLGSSRMQYLYPDGSVGNGDQTFTLNPNIPVNTFSYGGTWTIENEDAVSGKNAQILYNFTADKVYIILRPRLINSTDTVKVYLDGKIIDSNAAGADARSGVVSVTSDRLYNIVDLHGKMEQHTIRLDFQTPGTQAFTFTFG
ncbi:MAG: thioredoxin family protein, partial [Candidatus Levyibacteriota bacterium]